MKSRLLPLLGLLAFLFPFQPETPAAETPKTNVLWIYLEDVSGWFSCYGDTVISTPHIDALASDGIRFDRFYTPAGVCSTTRSSIITGMMQTTIGAHNHRSCRATFRGKAMGEFDENILPDHVKLMHHIFRDAGYYVFNSGTGKDDFNFTFDRDSLYDWSAGPLGFNGATKGKEWSGRKDGQPFFGQIQLRGGKSGGSAKRTVDRAAVPVPPYYPDVAEVREEIAHHYDCLLKTDREVGEIVAALKRDGLYDSTLILFFSDHGYKLHRHKQMLYEGGIHMPFIVTGPGAAKGTVRDDLISGIDIAPASLAAAGIDLPEHLEGFDFLADDYTERTHVMSARDRCDYTIEKIRAVVTPKYKYLRNYLTDRPYMQPTYKDGWDVTKKFRDMMAKGEMNETQLLFFGNERVPEEFYDLENDPHEINNLANDPAHAEALAHHRELLKSWIDETGDQGQATESDIGLLCALKRWGDKCVNPEYDKVRRLLKAGDLDNVKGKPRPKKTKTPKAPAAKAKKKQAKANARPNVLFILSDDQSWTDYGFMGHPHIETPRLDQLAAESLTYTRGYVTVPLCRPSLATLATGLYAQQHGITGNDLRAKGADLRDKADRKQPDGAAMHEQLYAAFEKHPNMVRELTEAGYLTLQTGKWWESNPKRMGFTHAMTHADPKRGGRHGDVGLKVSRDGIASIESLLDESKDSGKPFFIWHAPFLPHTPHNPPKELHEKYLAKEPSTFISRYYAMVDWFDQTCGELLDELDDRGLRENTLVIYVTDNGWIQSADSGRYAPLSKQDPHEGGIRTPFMVRWPGGDVTPKFDRATLVSTIDVAPTILTACGLDVPNTMPGLNLLDTDALAARDTIYGTDGNHDIFDLDNRMSNLEARYIIRGDWKLLLHQPADSFQSYRPGGPERSDAPELYNVFQDPHETTNLASRNPAKLAELTAAINTWFTP